MNIPKSINFNKEDAIKFYALNIRYNPTSLNIGILGDEKYFKKRIKEIMKCFDKTFKLIYKDRCLIVINPNTEQEIKYICITEPKDMMGLYFRKFI